MPITTYARKEDLLQTTDPDICEALGVLCRAPVVKEVPVRVRRRGRTWWRVSPLAVGYSVLWYLWETPFGPEWQVVTLYRDGLTSSTVITKELVLAYLSGCATHQEESHHGG
jgi:hypothetical protein